MSDHFDPYHVWLGIPPEESAAGRPNHYRLLGLRLFEANADVISNALDQRRAYLRSVQVGKRAAQSQQLLNEVSAAGVCLLDEAKKRRYDDELRSLFATAAPVLPEPALPEPAALPPAPPTMDPPSPHYAAPTALPAPVQTIGPRVAAARRTKTPAPPSAAMIALVISCGATLLLLAAGGAWLAWIQHQSTIAKAPPGQPNSGGAGQEAANSSNASPQAVTPPVVPFSDHAGKTASVERPASTRPTSAGPGATSIAAPGRSQQRVAMVFAGSQRVDVPIPLAFQRSGEDFTIEMWVRWDPYEPRGALLSCGALKLSGVVRDSSTRGNDPQFNDLELGIGTAAATGLANINPENWTHVAVMRGGERVCAYINGMTCCVLSATSPFSLGSSICLGANEQPNGSTPPFCGLVRDLRVSRGCRYETSGTVFKPEAKFTLDGQTAVLLNLEGPRQRGAPIQNLAGGTPGANLQTVALLPLTNEGDVAAEHADGTINLLDATSVALGTLEGETVQTASRLEASNLHGRSRVLVPYRPPAEYDLDLELTRLEGSGGAFIGLELAGQSAILAIDCFPEVGRRTGIVPADLSRVSAIPAGAGQVGAFAAGGSRPVNLSVRLRGSDFTIEIKRGGATSLASGSLRMLAVPQEFAIPLGHGMSLGSIDAKIRFDRVTLRPVNKEFPPEALAIMRDAAGRSRGSAAGSGVATASPQPPGPGPASSQLLNSNRRPLPDAEALAKGVEEARKLYENEAKAATKAPQKAALARRIMESGKATQNDATARYILLDLSRKLFIQAGEVQEAVAAARLLETEYEIPRDELIGATVEALDDAPLALEARADLAKIAADLADAAVDADQFDRADKISAIASQSAGKQRDAELKRDIAQRRANIVRIVKEWTTVKVSVEKVKADPADGGANLAAGKFYCFALDDFNQGLKHLAAGSDPQLADAAKSDIAAQGGDAAKRAAAAALWQQVAVKITERDDKLAVQRREKLLLQQAVVGLTGLDQVKANKRLEELKEIDQPRAKAVSGTAPRGRRNISLIGRLNNGNTDTGVLITYEHGYFITIDDFNRLLSAAGIASSQNLKVGLIGGFFLPVDQTVSLHQTGTSNNGGTYRVWIDNRQHGTVGFGNPTSSTPSFRLQAGPHMIRWEMTGGDFDTAQLELKSDPAVTGGTSVLIPIAIDRSLEVAAKQSPTKTTIHWGK